ncbi:hypothetical protein PCANC_09340 [Puccinia coronata f. sp. avenae]|uniref:Integrase catalytic domain-containing protein n=1 Tax=Puccinia coronata f. sp. avenae TaxID=200324 RepID=A0A2N5URS0_9BASI|nr:hypothetical protein PCANC_09340 [Puccinia coronata f. sp. avenae]
MTCESCRLSTSHQLPFSSKLPDAEHVLNFVYMDLSGKITPKLTGGGLYYFKITNAFSSFKCVFILSRKSQAIEKFKTYCNEVHNFHSQRIKNVVTDRGGEFCSAEFEQFYAEQGIIHHVTAPYTPQQNSIAERGNQTTSEKARALLKQAQLPSTLWGEAVITAVFYENITPMKRLKWKSPHEIWYGKPFDYSRLHSFGCHTYVNIPKEKRSGKFGDTSKKGILVGYRQGIRNWRILTAGHRVEYSHDVVFDNTCFPGISPAFSANDRDFIPFDNEEDQAEASSSPPVSAQSPSTLTANIRRQLYNTHQPIFYSPPSPFLKYPNDAATSGPPVGQNEQNPPPSGQTKQFGELVSSQNSHGRGAFGDLAPRGSRRLIICAAIPKTYRSAMALPEFFLWVKLQMFVVSTTKAKYRAIYDGVQEAVWLQSLMQSINGSSIYPIDIFTDNQAALALSRNPLANQRTKHIDVKFHFVCEAVDKGWVNISYISTAVMPADGLTKSLANPKHSAFLSFLKMKVRNLQDFLIITSDPLVAHSANSQPCLGLLPACVAAAPFACLLTRPSCSQKVCFLLVSPPLHLPACLHAHLAHKRLRYYSNVVQIISPHYNGIAASIEQHLEIDHEA